MSARDDNPEKAAFPVIDAHNHLWGDWSAAEDIVEIMDRVGVACYSDLTANISLNWGQGNYKFQEGDITLFFKKVEEHFPGRFYCFTTALFAPPLSRPLFTDAGEFVAKSIDMLREHVSMGARGLKILKEFGLHYRDGEGNIVFADDERLAPVWDEAGDLGVPVLMHQSDPVGFFKPVTPENEHYESLLKYPSWSFAGPEYPEKQEIIQHRDNTVLNHPGTLFILPHVANYAEDLDYVSRLLDENSNVYLDFSARIDELGRKPEESREFFIRYQDRILFGTDLKPSVDTYRCYFRFLETYSEDFIPPDYDGTFDRYRWKICGLGLPREVLEKIYFKNALNVIPGLRKSFNIQYPTRNFQ